MNLLAWIIIGVLVVVILFLLWFIWSIFDAIGKGILGIVKAIHR